MAMAMAMAMDGETESESGAIISSELTTGAERSISSINNSSVFYLVG
jgi:hypothetical protein